MDFNLEIISLKFISPSIKAVSSGENATTSTPKFLNFPVSFVLLYREKFL